MACFAIATPAYPSAYDTTLGSLVVVNQTAAINVAAFSFGCWVRITSTEFGFAAFAEKNDGATEGWNFYWADGLDRLTVTSFNAGADGEWWATWSGNLNSWTFISMSYDGSSDANDPTIYLNGISQSITESLVPSAAMVTGTSDLRFLQSPSGGGRWTGQIGECFYHDRVLTANEHRMIATCGPKSVPRQLVGYWPFGVFDARNYTSTASLTGTPTSVSAIGNGPPLRYPQGLTCE